MALEIVRELVNGVWETNVGSGGGGSGTVTEITSTDMSVTITDPNGPVVDLSASGGSQTLAQVLAEGNDANGLAITGLDDPTGDQDAATKAYVDAGGSAPDPPDTVQLVSGVGVVSFPNYTPR